MIVGFKLWYGDGSKRAIRVQGRERADIQHDVDALPAEGLQCVMIYYDEFSTDKRVRYRRTVSGNDHYFIMYDETPPPPLRDWLIGQSDKDADLTKYPQAKYIAGGFVNDTAYKHYIQESMADHAVSEFGIDPAPRTMDT